MFVLYVKAGGEGGREGGLHIAAVACLHLIKDEFCFAECLYESKTTHCH